MIRIFIGTSPNGEDSVAEKTLEYSLLKHSSEPLDIVFMRNREDGFLGEFNSSGWATPFTNLRWTIPEYCNFEGRAIYMDVDQLNLRDISILYNMDLQGSAIGSRSNRLCVMVIDCEKLGNLLAPVEKIRKTPKYGSQIYRSMLLHSQNFDPRWNCLDGEGRAIDDIWHLHFTKMPTQPWKPAWYKGTHQEHARPDLVELWEQYRDEACE